MQERLMRQSEPYHFQRLRHRLGEYPRPPQPNKSQPNQKPPTPGWGLSTEQYWGEVFNDYLRRRKTGANLTNLKLGGLR